MAVAVIIDIPDGTAEKYEHVIASLYPDSKLPDGWQRLQADPDVSSGATPNAPLTVSECRRG